MRAVHPVVTLCNPGRLPINFFVAPTQGNVALPSIDLLTQCIVVARKPLLARIDAGIVTGDAICIMSLLRGVGFTSTRHAAAGRTVTAMTSIATVRLNCNFPRSLLCRMGPISIHSKKCSAR